MPNRSDETNPLSGLRICFLAGTLGQGGAERQLFYILDQLRQAGACLKLLCLTRGEFWERRITDLGIRCVWVGQRKPRLQRLARIFEELRREPPDIVQSQHFYTNLYAALAGGALRLPVIGAIRSNVVSEVRENGRLLGNLCLRLPRHLAVNSSAAIRTAVANGVARNNLWLIPNVVDTARFHPPDKREPDVFRVLSVGRMDALKRFDRVLRVVAELRRRTRTPVRAVLAGDGPLRPALEKQAAALNLHGCVEFRGAVEDMTRLYRDAHALILASDKEGTPNVVLEAMASGLPVVATAVGGVPGLVDHNGNGFLAPPEDESGLVNAMLQLADDPGLCARMGAQGRAFVETGYAPASVLRPLRGLYGAALRRRVNNEER